MTGHGRDGGLKPRGQKVLKHGCPLDRVRRRAGSS
jgi:hypothetical protein